MNTETILPLSLDHLSFQIDGKKLIDNLSHRFNAGPRTIILGPNGAGKSLLLRLCHGLLEPTAGSVDWHGDPARKQAMVFQRPVMLRRTVAANVDYALSLKGIDRRTCAERTSKVLERTGLAHLAHTPARVLSFGEQQKLALARAWALKPHVLFLDEPFSALDYEMTLFMRDQLQALFMDTKTTMVFVSHDLEEAVYLADDVMLLSRGPAEVADYVNVGIPRPRTAATISEDEFVQIKAHCLEVFQKLVRGT